MKAEEPKTNRLKTLYGKKFSHGVRRPRESREKHIEVNSREGESPVTKDILDAEKSEKRK